MISSLLLNLINKNLALFSKSSLNCSLLKDSLNFNLIYYKDERA